MKKFRRAASMILALVLAAGLLPWSSAAVPMAAQPKAQVLAAEQEILYVTYNLNKGEEPERTWSVRVRRKGTLKEPTAPRRTGYLFGGWYDAAVGGHRFDFTSPVLQEQTLYAHWYQPADLEAARAVDAVIKDLGPVTLDSGKELAAARKAFEALTTIQQERVTALETLEYAEKELEDLQAAAAVDAQIAALGPITLASGEKLQAVRAACNALDAAQVSKLKNLKQLEQAEQIYADLVKEQLQDEDQAAAAAVDQQILSLNTDSTRAEVEAARAAFEALTPEQQALVRALPQLRQAEERLAKQEKSDAAAVREAERLIDKLWIISPDSGEDIRKARAAYESLTAEQKAMVENLAVLEAAEETYGTLRTQQNANRRMGPFPFIDVPSTQWYYDSVHEAWRMGLIDGMSATRFAPNDTLSVAQAVKLAAAFHCMEAGEKPLVNGEELWYSTYLEYAVEERILDRAYLEKSPREMNAPVSRAEFVQILNGALTDRRVINQVGWNAIPDVKRGDFASDAIYGFYRAGILTGSDAAGTFQPESSIRRSEVSAILIRMYNPLMRQEIRLK